MHNVCTFYGGHWNVLQYPLGIMALWTNRAGCLWGADWVGRWSINYDEKASARLTSLRLCLICSQGEILFSLQDQGKKWPGNHSAKPSVGRLCLGVVQHLLLYFPVEVSALFFLSFLFFCWNWLIFHNRRTKSLNFENLPHFESGL